MTTRWKSATLFAATNTCLRPRKYNLIYDAYGWERPTYVHVPPVMKDEKHKLSKRNGDASFQDLVAKGYLPAAIINYIALLGWAPPTEQGDLHARRADRCLRCIPHFPLSVRFSISTN